MKPGDLFLTHRMSSEVFNQFLSVTVSKSTSTSQTNERIPAAFYQPDISQNFLYFFNPVPQHKRNNQFPVSFSI